jgi:O-antigen ligase
VVESLSHKSASLILSAILFTSLIEQTAIFGRLTGNILLTVTVLLSGLYIIQQLPTVQIPLFPAILFLIIVFIWFGHLLTSASISNIGIFSLIRVPLFFLITSVYLFILPQAIAFDDFLHVISRFAVITILFGLPSYIFGSISIGDIQFGLATFEDHIFLTDIRFHPLVSVFGFSNILAFIAALGTVSSLIIFDNNRRGSDLFAGAICLLGVILSMSRGMFVVTIVAITFYAAYKYISSKVAKAISIVSVTGLCLLFALAFTPVLSNTFLNGRYILWNAAIAMASKSPLFGSGLSQLNGLLFIGSESVPLANPHNAFLTTLITTGLLGATSYLFLHVIPIMQATRDSISNTPVQTATLALVIAIPQIFVTYRLFGIGLQEFLASLCLGYAIIASISDLR